MRTVSWIHASAHAYESAPHRQAVRFLQQMARSPHVLGTHPSARLVEAIDGHPLRIVEWSGGVPLAAL